MMHRGLFLLIGVKHAGPHHHPVMRPHAFPVKGVHITVNGGSYCSQYRFHLSQKYTKSEYLSPMVLLTENCENTSLESH